MRSLDRQSCQLLDSLVEIARQTIGRPRLALGLAMAHESHLSRRVAHLGRSGGNERCIPQKAACFGVFGGGLLAVVLAALIQFGPAAVSASAQNDKPAELSVKTEKTAKKDQGATDKGKANPARKARPESEVNRLLDRLDELRPKGGEDEWAMVLRDLIEMGPDAVPDLIAEMDSSSNEYMLRCLAFVLRGIGDKRAIPALIRTLPKTCVPPCSDMGYIARDPKLLAFMQEHDNQDGPIGGTHYTFGRAVNEYRVTLQKLTGANQDENEIIHVFLQGTPRQQNLQRQLYQRCAEHWADWWKLHWKEFTTDENAARLELASLDTRSNPASEFPHGPRLKIDGRHSNHILESSRDPKAKIVFLDLDTGRTRGLPEHLKLAAGQPKRLDDVLAWATREGFDLMGTEYSPPKGDKSHFVLRGLGLNAWQIETDAWKKIEVELKKPELPKMGSRIEGLLAQFDPKAGQYRPEETATFLFQTREGGYGAIFVGVEVHDDRLQPGGAFDGDDELRPIAFSKGRRFAYTLVSAEEPEKP